LQTGKLQKAEFLSGNEKNKVIELFSKVWGIGAQISANLYFKGMRSLDDLRKNQFLLTRN
jgi:DNA polymerase lambda